MPGGRPQKPDAINRNKGKIESVDIPRSACRDVPELPPRHGLRAAGKRRWSMLWSTPVATMWEDEAADLVWRLCLLHDEFVAARGDVPTSRLAEMRQLEMMLGIGPRARRELRWRIVDDDGRLVEDDVDGSVSDLRRRLRVVDETTG